MSKRWHRANSLTFAPRLVRAFFGRASGLEHEAYAHLWLANLLRSAVRAALKSRYLGLRLSAFLVLPAWWISYIAPYFLLSVRG